MIIGKKDKKRLEQLEKDLRSVESQIAELERTKEIFLLNLRMRDYDVNDRCRSCMNGVDVY